MAVETWKAFTLLWIAFAGFPGPNAACAMAVGSRRGDGASLLASRLGRLIRTRHQAIIRNRTFATLFIGAGIALAFAGRR